MAAFVQNADGFEMLRNKVKIALLLTLLSCWLIFPHSISFSQLTENLRVRIYLVTTFPNATLTSQPLDNVLVTVKHVETGATFSALTADGGWARFWLNRTGQYNLTARFLDYIHVPKFFYIDNLNKTTYIYDNIYKLAKFFAGDQLTIFQLIKVELPAAIVFKIPKYSNFTAHIDAYGGLKWEQMKLEDRHVFTPYDISSPRFTPTGEIFYPNYTVRLNFKTVEDGNIGLLIGSNASYTLVSDPLYCVPKDVWVRITYTVFTYKRPEVERLERVETILEQILTLLMQIRDMINKTVIPKLNDLRSFVQSLFDKTFGNINFQGMYEKLKEIDYNVKMVRDTLMMFSSEFKENVRSVLREQVGDIRTIIYAFGGIAFITAIVVGFSRKKSGEKQSKERSVIVK